MLFLACTCGTLVSALVLKRDNWMVFMGSPQFLHLAHTPVVSCMLQILAIIVCSCLMSPVAIFFVSWVGDEEKAWGNCVFRVMLLFKDEQTVKM